MIKLLPYTSCDGIPTLRNSDIIEIYNRIIKDESGHIFYDGLINNKYDFLKMVKDPRTIFYVVRSGIEDVAIVWINRIENKQGRIHFCAFSSIWGMAIDIGRETTRQLLYKKHGGEYCFDLFLGITPSSNKLALTALKRLGCKIIDEIPNIVWDDNLKKSVPGNLVYITREVLDENL